MKFSEFVKKKSIEGFNGLLLENILTKRAHGYTFNVVSNGLIKIIDSQLRVSYVFCAGEYFTSVDEKKEKKRKMGKTGQGIQCFETHKCLGIEDIPPMNCEKCFLKCIELAREGKLRRIS